MQKNRWKTRLGIAVMIVMLAAVTGCNGNGSGKVTVKTPPIREANAKVELKRIDRQDDSYGLAWLSDTEIISTKSPLWKESELYAHSLIKEKDPDRRLGVENAITVNPSPLRTHLFVSNRMEASFVNMKDGIKTPLDINDGTYSILNGDVRGAWLGEEGYVLAVTYGLGIAELDGRITPILKMNGRQFPVKVESAPDKSIPDGYLVYFIDQAHSLYKLRVVTGTQSLPMSKGEPELIRQHVADFSVSPDGNHLALSVETGDNNNTLTLMQRDAPLKETIVAEGRLARQMSWSPDGSKLAYSLFNLERGSSGLYVMDTKSGYMTLVSLYPNLKSLLVWSPDSNLLMMSQENPEMNLTTENTKLMTEIYRFK
ncbi:hypothetical protein GRF59_05630 [Paenibacillus sp. HJL G12]|uniref:Uncharacterized protein n=1 Tax=Paenibacillus dendrobii TaxID=2691084 RepID=A0A7X3IFX8_9BACL|nr:PD40 domain-containing protein [Paenibacillus dendrobii]MWV43105.1 hypothetical protein [Paenibacillus dendrobii]